jgi:peptide/nickel transport system substrate-binding protein
MAKRKGQAAVLALLAVAVAGCESPARSRPWSHARPAPEQDAAPPSSSAALLLQEQAEAARRRSHTLRVHLTAEPPHLNPLSDPDVETLRITEDTVYETLLRVDGDHYTGLLAEAWRVSGDGRVIVITTRDRVTWHDGAAFGAWDVQFTIDAIRGKQVRAPRHRAALAQVMSVEKLGPREVRIILKQADGFVLRALAEIPIMPYHLFKDRPADLDRAAANREPIGTGPYRVTSWRKGERILLTRWDRYWGKAAGIEDVEFVIEKDAAQAVTRAKAGELDLLPAMIPEHWPDQPATMRDDWTELRLRPARFQYLALNASRPPFDDARVRRAVALAVDRPRIAAEMKHGFAVVQASPIWKGGPGDAEGPAIPAFDPDAAAALLAEAGWIDAEKDGVRDRAGQALHIVFLATSEARGDAERDLVVAGLRRVGFRVEVRSGEPAVLMNRLRDAEFDIAMVDWRGRADDDLRPIFGTGGAANFGRFSSKPMDAALHAVALAADPAARAPRLAELGALFEKEQPIVVLTAPDPHGLIHRRVKGVAVHDGWLRLRDLTF